VIEGVSPDLPHTDRLPAPKEWGCGLARPLVRLGCGFPGGSRCMVPSTFHGRGSDLGGEPHRDLGRAGSVGSDRRLTFALVKAGGLHRAVGRFPRLYRSDFAQPPRDRPASHSEGDSGAASRQGAGGLPEGLRSGGEVAWARARCGVPGHGVGAPIVRWPFSALVNLVKARTSCPAAGIDSSGLRGAVRHSANSWPRRKQQLQSGPQSYGSAWPITCGRCAGADRATLAGAAEGQNPSSAPTVLTHH
jgi:hypothetical protein